MSTYPIVLSIAGSDPSGGAGIQADLKTFAALGCYGAAAISALTVQNTLGVYRSVPVEALLVAEQVEAVIEDIPPHAIKIGMVGCGDTIEALSEVLERYRGPFVVLDPILVSSSGRVLLPEEARRVLVERLMPLCTMVTPNLPELETLTQEASPLRGARRLIEMSGVAHVLVKGGHRSDVPRDILVSSEGVETYDAPRIATRGTHGTGCTLSAAIAAFVARGYDVPAAVAAAKEYVTRALRAGADVTVGHGVGPMNHLFDPLPAIVREI
jgi:hydroxymethylpyrimidine/phosphomethylpyrimidine kinase